MKLLFLACLSPKTGNCTTAERIRAHVESAGHTCVLRDASEFKSSAEVAKLVTQKPPFDGALAIHLYKAGRLLLDVPVPFGVVFGGTDINEDVKVEHKLVVMKQVLLKARFAVAFTAKMKQMAYVVLRSPSSKIYIQPQGIRTEATEKFSWGEFLKSSGLSGARAEQHRVFLLVCGLRRVKDPLYLAEVFTEWHREDPLNVLVIIGPEIDSALTEEVEAVAQRRAGVFLAQGRSQRELHAVVRRCFAVVNSSISEGMSAAILEAMHLEVPVVARDIPGNAAVVQHEVTGLLYSSPQEFVCQSQRLLSDGELRGRLVRTAKLYVEQQHSVERERETYHRLVQSLQ
ncbi:glycosyltransferase 1 domain-containing protein 1 isoform X1 [Gadus macrocephalus]|uniref:glycosyltransferase 1 domain-containing protein 1 isoform X1 n=1 Tax=Gadus macrocephalus TaxID=80720 RepID=UPI0028CB49BA|nr:glycosyltransferase 1 domain-containing protein 1 isoform X1 [Gadus macrocephalus]XP_059910968.1 glycosyltransferase 1 domain-containing protein 1 isoform X1 [Gadus macrocephalus]XP_059910969.1 glycosyltransferase 1 domain-containing protein 1 isoform X1 [Gadus macrocephalus]XP_059910970.1 glycosyltransferase 1 domain-containing protein 1 isoform X1 [Gadus macrocephalus]